MAKITRRPPGRRRTIEEPKEDLMRWLLTYADMITLLLLFFIILYTISSMNISKYKEVSAAFASVFSGGNFGLLFDRSNVGTSDLSNITPQQPAQTTTQANRSLLFTKAVSQLKLLIKQNKVRVVANEQGVVITLLSDLSFGSGSAQVRDDYIPVLQQIANFIRDLPNRVRIEGHTDNTPTDETKWASNWDLAAARAINILTVMEAYGVPADRMSAVSYGSTRPLMSNDTPEGRAYNRRVDVVIVQRPEQLPD